MGFFHIFPRLGCAFGRILPAVCFSELRRIESYYNTHMQTLEHTSVYNQIHQQVGSERTTKRNMSNMRQYSNSSCWQKADDWFHVQSHRTKLCCAAQMNYAGKKCWVGEPGNERIDGNEINMGGRLEKKATRVGNEPKWATEGAM